MVNTLASVLIPVFSEGADISLNFLAKLIQLLIENLPTVGLGIIVYTLILKTVVLPLDIYSKVVTRKQSLKMEQMRPQLEKLQKQYANDKEMYSRKMMELYKQNNYSVFSACLPAIVMMLLFIFVFQAFNSYSQYANLHNYNMMIESYNASVSAYTVQLDREEGYLVPVGAKQEEIDVGGVMYVTFSSEEQSRFIYAQVNAVNVEEGKIKEGAAIEYYIDTDKMLLDSDVKSEVEEIFAGREEDEEVETMEDACLKWVKTQGRNAAGEKFSAVKFLWIKNIWYADTTVAHPVRSYSDFVSSISSKVEIDGKKYKITEYASSPYKTETAYNEITYNLSSYKEQSNGYYILIVLSIGSMFLSQFVMSKMQKAQTELQSVDGSAKGQMKMMMIMMPIIYGIFSFGYSSAFSVYMITSNFYSILTSVATTLIVDAVFRKKAQKAEIERYEKRYRASKGLVKDQKKKK